MIQEKINQTISKVGSLEALMPTSEKPTDTVPNIVDISKENKELQGAKELEQGLLKNLDFQNSQVNKDEATINDININLEKARNRISDITKKIEAKKALKFDLNTRKGGIK